MSELLRKTLDRTGLLAFGIVRRCVVLLVLAGPIGMALLFVPSPPSDAPREAVRFPCYDVNYDRSIVNVSLRGPILSDMAWLMLRDQSGRDTLRMAYNTRLGSGYFLDSTHRLHPEVRTQSDGGLSVSLANIKADAVIDIGVDQNGLTTVVVKRLSDRRNLGRVAISVEGRTRVEAPQEKCATGLSPDVPPSPTRDGTSAPRTARARNDGPSAR